MKKIYVIILILLISCDFPEIARDELIYENDFEDSNLSNISGGGIISFNNTKVLGNFNNDGFILHIDKVGTHSFTEISFDLYIHGSWDGNKNGFELNDKADKWGIELKPDMNNYTDPSKNLFLTTFSNSPCFPNYCLRQSYPNNYPYENLPKTGSYENDLESVCDNNFFGGKTSLYKFEKIFESSGDAIIIRMYDELYQPNAIDKDGIPQMKCDESWSIDNLKVRVIEYK